MKNPFRSKSSPMPSPMPSLLEIYDRYPISQARDDISTLTDQAAYHEKRIILTKQGRPVAVIVPIRDLEVLHARDVAEFESIQSRQPSVDDQEVMSLAEAAAPPEAGLRVEPRRPWLFGGRGRSQKPPPPHLGAAIPVHGGPFAQDWMVRDVIMAACTPVLIATIEKTIVDGVASRVSGLSAADDPSVVRRAVVEGIRESFHRPAPTPGLGIETG